MSGDEINWFTAAAGFFAGPGFQTTSNHLGSTQLGFKADGPDGDLQLVPGEDPDPNTLVTLDGGETWQNFTVVSSGEVWGTPSIFNASGIPDWDPNEPLIAVVIQVGSEKFVFFPDYPDATGKLPGLIKIGNDGKPIFICFVAGTMILTPKGEVPVEELCAGDMVMTRDNGPQPLRWVGKATVPVDEVMAPVRIRAGAFGPGRPARDLRVSPQHRLLVSGAALELTMGMDEALVPAKHLVNDSTILRDRSEELVTYHHILFDRHEIITSDGLPTESFHPGQWGLGALEEQTREELVALFPELGDAAEGFGPSARPSLKRHEAVVLATI